MTSNRDITEIETDFRVLMCRLDIAHDAKGEIISCQTAISSSAPPFTSTGPALWVLIWGPL